MSAQAIAGFLAAYLVGGLVSFLANVDLSDGRKLVGRIIFWPLFAIKLFGTVCLIVFVDLSEPGA